MADKGLGCMEPYNSNGDVVLKEHGTEVSGLKGSQVAERLEKYGKNEIEAKEEVSAVKVFLMQFKSPFIYVLMGAALLSFSFHEYIDALVIVIIIEINAVIGFIQERKAEKAFEALSELQVPTARVRRDGSVREVSSKDIVPGDILLLSAGDRVSADARALDSSNLSVDESMLTGESILSMKHTDALRGDVPLAERYNMVYAGTIIVAGRGEAVVTATGMNTEFGNIVRLTSQTEEDFLLNREMKRFSKFLILLVTAFLSMVFVLGLWRGMPIYTLVLTVVAQACSAIPEGLPIAITVALSIGVWRMARKNTLVRHLSAVKSLGSLTVICTDKTGTLTRNEMTVVKTYFNGVEYEVTGEGYDLIGDIRQVRGESGGEANSEYFLRIALETGCLCNASELEYPEDKKTVKVVGAPTEGALLVLAEKGKMDYRFLRKSFERLDEVPFDSKTKIMLTMHRAKGGIKRISAKGAPEKILELCDSIVLNGEKEEMTDEIKRNILEKVSEYSAEELRVLGLAYFEGALDSEKLSEIHIKLTFLGLVGMMDPPREEAKEAIAQCHEAGVKPVMITGDSPNTGLAIAKDIGIVDTHNDEVMDGPLLDRTSDEELKEKVENIRVFARVTPEHKLRIVNAFKSRGEVVAMTGDGINDMPALKKADVGIAMGVRGTEAAKEASDVVLTDDNFKSIVGGINEGRKIRDNIDKALFFLLATSLGEILFLTVILLVAPILPIEVNAPLLAIQILWINLVTDTMVIIPLMTEKGEDDIMKKPPRDVSEPLLSKRILIRVLMMAVTMGFATVVVFTGGLFTGTFERARTMAFAFLIIFQWFNALNARSLEKSIFRGNFFENKYLFVGIFAGAVLTLGAIYLPLLQSVFRTLPLAWGDWLFLILLSFLAVVVMESYKALSGRGTDKKS